MLLRYCIRERSTRELSRDLDNRSLHLVLYSNEYEKIAYRAYVNTMISRVDDGGLFGRALILERRGWRKIRMDS